MEDQLYIPIPHYPPFQLRSSLIDKDPVIWAHLLETYIELCQLLLQGEVRLNVKSQQQLQLFLKVFLAETGQEATKIFSLGAINPDIKKNTSTLRAYVFQVIRDYGFVKLGLPKECLWNFVVCYVEKNATVVRGLLNGTLKSKFNDNKKSGKISQIPHLRKYLQDNIRQGTLPLELLKYLSVLLGQHTSIAKVQTVLVTGAGLAKPRVVSKDRTPLNSLSALQFAESFVNEEWIETLESLYAGGKSVHADDIKNVMIVSVLSLSTAKLASIVTTLGIHSTGTMMISPLLCSILISESYKKLCPGLEERLHFLNGIDLSKSMVASDEHIAMLDDMFPNISFDNATSLLLKHNNDIDAVINLLLENPELVHQQVKNTKDIKKPKKISTLELENGLKRFSLKDNETTEKLKKLGTAENLEETKKNTLTHALRLLYESDEDERDDTYDELQALEETSKPSNSKKSLNSLDERGEVENSPHKQSEYDIVSILLFGFLKQDGEALFLKTSRKTKRRGEMRSLSSWTDEQIEGWFRMLQKSPKRFRLLEEQYVFENSNRAVAARAAKATPESETPRQTNNEPKTRGQLARKEKNKASIGNHNRKSGHSRKAKAELAGIQ